MIYGISTKKSSHAYHLIWVKFLSFHKLTNKYYRNTNISIIKSMGPKLLINLKLSRLRLVKRKRKSKIRQCKI